MKKSQNIHRNLKTYSSLQTGCTASNSSDDHRLLVHSLRRLADDVQLAFWSSDFLPIFYETDWVVFEFGRTQGWRFYGAFLLWGPGNATPARCWRGWRAGASPDEGPPIIYCPLMCRGMEDTGKPHISESRYRRLPRRQGTVENCASSPSFRHVVSVSVLR